MKRTATAIWNGSGKEGNGNLTTQSTVLNQNQYSFNTRFADGVGTNPEELLAASHAGCFTMAVSAALTQQGISANELHTKATVDFDVTGPVIAGIHLELTGSAIDGVSEEQFRAVAEGAKANCPISKALAATPITLSVIYG